MTGKTVVPRALAIFDVEDAVDHYQLHAGDDVAIRVVHALRTAYSKIAERPRTGSPWLAHELDLPGLRTRRIDGFPHLIFYLECEDHIDIWRVLHDARDIRASLLPPDLGADSD